MNKPLASLVAAAAIATAQNSTPWTPAQKTANVSLSYVFDGAQNFKAGTNDARLPARLDQNSFFASLEYGITNRLSADLLTGYTRTSLGTSSLDGVADSLIGVRVKAYSGEKSAFTLRAAGVIAGSYPLTNLGPFAPGFKASGFLGSALYGVTMAHGTYVSSELGFSVYNGRVSNRVFGSLVAGQAIGKWSYFGGYQQSRATGGIDIGGPGFSPSRFPEIRRIYGGVDAGGGYTMANGTYFGATYGHYLHGRNVGKKSAVAITVGFQIPPQK